LDAAVASFHHVHVPLSINGSGTAGNTYINPYNGSVGIRTDNPIGVFHVDAGGGILRFENLAAGGTGNFLCINPANGDVYSRNVPCTDP